MLQNRLAVMQELEMGLIRKKEDYSARTFDISVHRGKIDRKGTIAGLEKNLNAYRSEFQSNPGAGTELAKRLAILSVLYKDEGNLDRSEQFREEAISVISSKYFPVDDDSKIIRDFVDSLR